MFLNTTFDNISVTHGYYAKVGPVIGQMMAKANLLGIPANSSFRVAGGDLFGVGYKHNNNVMLKYDPANPPPHPPNKFAAAHELAGHPLGSVPINGDPVDLTGSDYNYVSNHTSQYCNCSLPHCLHSVEKIHSAQNEGWAHFISTVLFNTRGQGDGTFGGYRDTPFDSSVYPGESNQTAPWPLDVTVSRKWKNLNCPNDPANTGTEYDWLTFFWQVWDSDQTIEISQLQSIWPTENDGHADWAHYWDNTNNSRHGIVDRAASSLNIGELTRFITEGVNNGVANKY